MTARRLVLTGLAFVLIGAALGARALGVRPVQIKSNSMSPTVRNGDWIVVSDLEGESRGELRRGDIAMFRFPLGTDGRAIKRVLAVAGDRITIGPRSVAVNGKSRPIAGAPGPGSARARTETVPPGHVYLLGDNSANSIDSRAFGAVPTQEIVGRQLATAGDTASLALKALVAIAAIILVLLGATVLTQGRRPA
jgi:signal peptidase I